MGLSFIAAVISRCLPRTSFLWFVGHELRLAYRSYGGASRWRRVVPMLLMLALPCLLGPGFAWYLRDVEPLSPRALGTVSLIAAGLLLLFVSTASIQVLRMFGERADLDLLLAAPVPPSRILAAKSVAVYATVALPYLALTMPFLLAAALFGHPGWLGAPVMIVVIAVVATSLAQLLARAMFSALGIRAARTVYQVVGGLLGATLFLTVQATNLFPGFRTGLAHAAAHAPPPPLDWPARAALGSWTALLTLLALAVSGAWATARWSAASLGHAEAPAATPRRIASKVKFGAGPIATIVRKELHLLARDPELLSQLTLQMVYMLPIVVLIFTGEGGLPPPRVAAACTAFAALLASNLSWLIVCAEDAPELLDAAPVRRATTARAKLLAACLPSLATVVVLTVLLAPRYPLASAVALTASTGAALTTALLQARFGKPQPRRALRRRANGSLPLTFGELGIVACWAATAGLLASCSSWALLPLVPLLVLLAALVTGRGGIAGRAAERDRG